MGRVLEIVSFEKYQGRKDVDRPSWFRLQNSLASDPQFFEFDSDEKWFMVSLFCLTSVKNSGIVTLSDKALSEYARVPVEKVVSAIHKLIELGTLHKRDVSDTSTIHSRDDGDRTERQRDRDNRERDKSASALPRIAQIWNQGRGELPEVRGCSASRRRCADARWREVSDPEYWARIVARIVRSPFCSGDNDRGWRADFDFLIRPETRHKVEEGKYDDRGKRGLPGPISTEEREEQRMLDQMRSQAMGNAP